MQKHTSQDSLVQMVVFTLHEKEYGIPVYDAKEVIKVPKIVEMPNAPQFISGVINLRGSIICIVDLRKQFNFPVKESEELRIIIVRIKKMLIGLIVDKVNEVLKISKSKIESVPRYLDIQIPNNCIVGIAKQDERIITLLNLNNILSIEQLLILDEQNVR